MVHLYFKAAASVQVQQLIDVFPTTQSIDISNMQTIHHHDVYFVEIYKVEKTLLLHVRKLLSNKKNNLIYFFVGDAHSLMLYQLSAMLQVKSIVTDKSDMSLILPKIKSDILLSQETKLEKKLVNNISKEYSFMLFNSKDLTFVSKKAYIEFGYTKQEDISFNICSQIDLDTLLESDTSLEIPLSVAGEVKNYFMHSVVSSNKDEVFVYIEPITNKQIAKKDITSENDFIKVRIYFIEILKEKILERSISESKLGIITIQIENMTSMREDWDNYDIEIAIRDLLLQVQIELDSHTLLAQYNNHVYITLFENVDFDTLKVEAEKINTHLIEYAKDNKIKPALGIYALDIADLELNTILNIVSNMSKNQVSHKDITDKQLHRISNVQEELNENVVIDKLLESAFVNKSPIKLQNLYKGLCITTASNILKKTENTIYLKFEKLQGTVMGFEKETIMQSSGFTKDILATVKYIDFKKNIVQLENFNFSHGNANSRQYSRVTCSQRTPITLTHEKGNINGVILDISLNSIAIKTRLYDGIDSLKLSKIRLNFTLPSKNHEFGSVKIVLQAKVVFSKCDDKFCKIVVNLFENQEHEATIMEYVYGRQKEIIVELKKQASIVH